MTRDALERASLCRFLSLLFQPPQPGWRDELLHLADRLPAALAADAQALAAASSDDIAEYHRALGAGACADCESDYEPSTLAGKGPLIGDVAGFYRAFAFEPEIKLAPDHLSVELGFLGYLALKEAYATHRISPDHAERCRDAAGKFAAEHLAQWLPTFLARLETFSPDGFYGGAVKFTRRALDGTRPS